MPAIGEMLQKLNPWHQDAAPPPPPPPPITVGTAATLLALYALVYFIPFYLSRTTRPSAALSRDAPSVIRARIRSVTLSCLLCTATTYVVLVRTGGEAPAAALHLLGVWPPAAGDSFRVLLLTALLFAGPLFSYLIVERGWYEWMRLAPVKEVWSEWTTWRNIVAGPITEEILFRSASVPLMLLAQAPIKEIIFLSPIIFGLAHVHHFYEFRLSHPQVSVSAAVLRSVFQLGYTTLFGAYATFLFVRTGSLLAVCAVHAFCNCMGLPQVWGRVEPESLGGNGSGGGRRPSILWSVAYYVLLVAGAVLWWRNLWVLSESENALMPTSEFSGGAA
ncbi:putative CAAX prenyl protease 2 [Madurella mycetomatis]|uniref:intramembrane prenyl-peptidase Rce1 n=1 Tax=Madurella mycetomatis TaxID=100816 RepID=A0A175VVN4_9PEZI|nr:putative CAAX prenyl protease 2 [Madurella mycetomatis]